MPCWHIFFSTWQLKMIARYCNYLKIVKTMPQHYHLCVWVCVCEVAQLCANLCDPMDCSLADFSIRGIFQPRVLEWDAISFSRGSSRPGDQTQVSCLAGDALLSDPQGKPNLEKTLCTAMRKILQDAAKISGATTKTWCSQIKKKKVWGCLLDSFVSVWNFPW